jgi:hypothetical protein
MRKIETEFQIHLEKIRIKLPKIKTLIAIHKIIKIFHKIKALLNSKKCK